MKGCGMKKRNQKSVVFSVVMASALLASSLDALALPRAEINRPAKRAQIHMTTVRETLPPFAFAKFCANQADQCDVRGGQEPISMTKERRLVLQGINAQVNKDIRYKDDPSDKDLWRAGVSAGDCDDYALTKRQKLLAAGWPSSALRIATARTEEGIGHAVLVVSTTEGDFVLDNRTNVVKPWYAARLYWIKIQSQDDPRKWLTF
jgi:predicted transglutaminase-like cysteine proteinase